MASLSARGADTAIELGGEASDGGGVTEPVVVDVGTAKTFHRDAAKVSAGFEQQNGTAHFACLDRGSNTGGGGPVDTEIGLARLGGEGEQQLAAVHSVSAVTWARRLATPAV